MRNLMGKIALITGGNSCIGYAAAKQLKENGAQVIITGRRKDTVENASVIFYPVTRPLSSQVRST
jgi:NADP-dependent 3-hydroxy acid dehydrogenase YdfG